MGKCAKQNDTVIGTPEISTDPEGGPYVQQTMSLKMIACLKACQKPGMQLLLLYLIKTSA